MSTMSRVWLAGIVLLAGAVVPASAGTISLAWSSVDGAAGYRIYYGLGSANYNSTKDVGSVTEATLTGLTDCTAYYMAVKAYNSAGESAGFSNEISGWARPVVTAAVPGSLQQGDDGVLEIQGANFKAGASVSVDNPQIGFASATVLGCNRIQLDVAVAPAAQGLRAAEVGTFTLDVVNPDGTYGTKSQGLEVQADPARFDVNQSDASTRGRLDGRDTVWLARLFGSQENADALYDPDFDLDGNGWVDGADLAYVASNLGRCWSGTAWTVQACPVSGP